MLKEEALYGLFLEVKGPNGEVIKEKQRIGELGSRKEKEAEKKHLQDVSPTDGNNSNIYTVSFVGNSSYYNSENQDKIKESVEEEKPYYYQRGEDYEPEFIGFAKDYDSALDLIDSDTVYRMTVIDELDEDMYLAMRDDLDEEDVERLDAYFKREKSSDLPEDVEIEYASLNSDTIENYDIEEAIKQYLQEHYTGTVEDFSYYWYDNNTLLIHDIKWSTNEDLHEDKLLEYTTYWFGEREYPSKKVDHGEYDPHTGEFADGTTLDDLEDWELEENIDSVKVKVYNDTEAKSMNEKKKLEESIEELKKKYPNAKVLQYDYNRGAFIISKEELDDWEY